MPIIIPQAVQRLIEEYRRFLRTSYRFLDNHLRRQFEEHLAQADVVVKGPYVTLTKDFQRGATLAELSIKGLLHQLLLKANWPFGSERLFRHQEKALEAGRAGRSFVITTGTGSGKTEAFLLPVLDGIIRRKEEGVKGVQAVFIYPMNALANDQLERLRRLFRGGEPEISFGLYTGDSDLAAQTLREMPAKHERLKRAEIRSNPPDIILTNYKQLEFLLVRREDRGLFTRALRFLVLDEIHSYKGALATELSCLTRRLKKHAGLEKGELVCIGTSATVISKPGALDALARFATTLFGEEVKLEDIIGEYYKPDLDEKFYLPQMPAITKEELSSFDPQNDASVISLSQRLTGKTCPVEGTISTRVASILKGNIIVKALEDIFVKPSSIKEAVKQLREVIPERADVDEEALHREIEAYLLVSSIGDEEYPPRLRPKLHVFFHGIYDVALCLNPDCRTLVPHGSTECPRCGSATRPAALCRTCGQDFVKVRFEREDDDTPVGTGDFFTDEHTAFLTHKIRELPEAPGAEDEEGEENKVKKVLRGLKHEKEESKLTPVGVCPGCGRLLAKEGDNCPSCNRLAIAMFLHRGKLSTCPACGDRYSRGDIVTPLRTGTASTVSILTRHHLDSLEGEDRKLLVFADNRQDAAHQAGYTADKHNSFALRHTIAYEVRQAGKKGLALAELPERLLDAYRSLGIIPNRLPLHERERWLYALTYQVANEFTRYSRQRASLENLGLVGVEYEFLEELGQDERFLKASARAGLENSEALLLVRAVLDVMRKNRAVAYDFFQEYIDPGSKRRYRELESEPYNVRFPDLDRAPKAFALNRPDHIRKAHRLMGFIQENPRSGQLAAPQKLAFRLIGDRENAKDFLTTVVELLREFDILIEVHDFPIPKSERVSGLHILQIAPSVIRLLWYEEGFRCNACQTWRPYKINTCPTPKCTNGKLIPVSIDRDNYYVQLYLEHPPRRLVIAEHSAQIPGEIRAKREVDFKEGKLDALVCTPTLELGVDIGPLMTVVLRNAPPTPANYAQRVGRAGRRLRIGFVSTFCAGGAHDRHAFEHPDWFVAGNFDPPRLRLDNHKVVFRHLKSYLLECLDTQLPARLGDLLDDIIQPRGWKPELLDGLFQEIRKRRYELIKLLAKVMEDDLKDGRVMRYGIDDAIFIVNNFERELSTTLEAWWQRVKQIDQEYREYSKVGSPRQDEKKASARKRAYYEITQDPERAYTLNYLANRGVLPSYQFPVDSFSLDPGVADTQTIYRSAAISIEEFAPGNFVYANGHKLRSIRVLYPGGPGVETGKSGVSVRPGRSDAETTGRLQSFHFCDECGEAVEAGRNTCPHCGANLPAATDVVFVDAFEAEESFRISSDEESRQRQFYERRESLLAGSSTRTRLYPYQFTPIELLNLAEILVTNWGPFEGKTGEAKKFFLCPDCGRHMPYDPGDQKQSKQVKNWREYHARFCKGEPAPLVLAYKFQTDSLVLTIPSRKDTKSIGRSSFSPTAVTLAEALLAGAGNLLQLETRELSAFVRKSIKGSLGEQIVFYETVPGGAGYLEEMAERLPEVAKATMDHLFGHDCLKACYLCLKHYHNQRWHPFFNKDEVRDLLLILSQQEAVKPKDEPYGSSIKALNDMLCARVYGKDPIFNRYTKGEIEEPLRSAILKAGVPEGKRDFEIHDNDGKIITVPDFTWPDIKLAVYCDGFAVHANPQTLERDASKRNFLQSQGWVVLTYWGRTILRDPEGCANQIAQIWKQRSRKEFARPIK